MSLKSRRRRAGIILSIPAVALVAVLLGVPIAIGIPLGIAALLNEHVRGWRFFRSVYFLPTAISWVVIGMFALRFFSATGVFNQLLSHVGFGSQATDMLAGERSALTALAVT